MLQPHLMGMGRGLDTRPQWQDVWVVSRNGNLHVTPEIDKDGKALDNWGPADQAHLRRSRTSACIIVRLACARPSERNLPGHNPIPVDGGTAIRDYEHHHCRTLHLPSLR